MAISDLDNLPEDTRRVVDEYLERTAAGFCAVAEEIGLEVLEDLHAHLLDALDADSTPGDARAVLAGFGEPDEFAQALCREVRSGGREPATEEEPAADGHAPGSGTILGIPYDVRMPTPERVASRWWDPQNPRVWVPKTFGAGWTINFGALAVKLKFIRPDDEDEPFASVPDGWLAGALTIPVALTLGIAATWWRLASSLPAQVPVHWDIAGRPDNWAAPVTAFGFLLAMAGVPTLWAVWSYATPRSRGARALSSAGATLLATLAAGIFAGTLAEVFGGATGAWFIFASILAGIGLPFAMLVVLARINRREEWRKDLQGR